MTCYFACVVRPNLTYDVRKKTGKFMDEIADYVRKHVDDSGIIYWYVNFLLPRLVESLT